MDLRPMDILGGFYADDSKPWSVQDTVNWLPEVAEVRGTRTDYKLASPPGMREFMRLGDRPGRGMRNVEGQLFVVCGNNLHQVSTKATSTVRGQLPGIGRVQMAHNQITGGNELLLVNGQSTGYVWNTAKSTYLRITDDGYPGARAADYLDGYLPQVEPFGRFWFHSQLANALDYNTLDRYESEASPDKIVTLVVSQFDLVVFNETTTEFFYNAGGSTGTFQSKRTVIDRGCASGDTVQKLDNSVFWLGNDGVVYRLNGYAAVPISTGPIQAAIRDNNWKQAFAFTWEDGKHKVYYLTFPDGKTWGYDVVTGVWHRRASFGLDRWRLNHLVRWSNMWIGSDFQDGRLWVLDWDYMLEGDQPLVSERIGPVGHNNQAALNVNYAELLVSMGLEETLLASAPGPDPNPEPVWQPIDESSVVYTFTPDPNANSCAMNNSIIGLNRFGNLPGGGTGWVLNIAGSGVLGFRMTLFYMTAQDGAAASIGIQSSGSTEAVANTSATPTTNFEPSVIERNLPINSSGIRVSQDGLQSGKSHTSGWVIEVLTTGYTPP